MSENLELAQRTLEERCSRTNDRYRPGFHASVPTGWLNDPNGFTTFQGKAHLYYQFNPYDSAWGDIHWGHWSSEDLTHWKVEPVALAPDEAFDAVGCFSGTSIEVDGKLHVIYTGVQEETPNGQCFQQQCIAESADGIHFTKWQDNPVIGRDKLPEGDSPYDFRDPKIWRTEDGYRVVTAVRSPKCGQLITFTSKDLHDWSYEGVFVDGLGDMAECPDYFRLDGRDMVIACLMHKEKPAFPHGQLVNYLVGKASGGHFDAAAPLGTVDWGMDFYAPETMEASDGRRILIGWAFCWGHMQPTHTLGHGWAGIMTMARECSLKNDTLCQQPVREMALRRVNEQRLAARTVDMEVELPECSGRQREIDLTLDVSKASSVTLRLMKTGDEAIALTWTRENNRLRLDRGACGHPMTEDGAPEEIPYSEAPISPQQGRLRLRVFVDVSIVEVFVGDGEVTMSTLAFPKAEGYGVSLTADGAVQLVEGTSWEIE